MLLPIDADTFSVDITELWLVSLGIALAILALGSMTVVAMNRDKNPTPVLNFIMSFTLICCLQVASHGSTFESEGRASFRNVRICLRHPDFLKPKECDRATALLRSVFLYETADEKDYPRLARTAAVALGNFELLRFWIASALDD